MSMKFTMKRAMAALLTCSICVAMSACAPSGEKENHTGSQPSSAANTGEKPASGDFPSQVQPEAQEEIITITAHDGLTFEGKLRISKSQTGFSFPLLVLL